MQDGLQTGLPGAGAGLRGRRTENSDSSGQRPMACMTVWREASALR